MTSACTASTHSKVMPPMVPLVAPPIVSMSLLTKVLPAIRTKASERSVSSMSASVTVGDSTSGALFSV